MLLWLTTPSAARPSIVQAMQVHVWLPPPTHIHAPCTYVHIMLYIWGCSVQFAVCQDGSVLVAGYQFAPFNVEPGDDSGRRR